MYTLYHNDSQNLQIHITDDNLIESLTRKFSSILRVSTIFSLSTLHIVPGHCK